MTPPGKRGRAPSRQPITRLAKVIRSKNSGPFELTLDIILKRKKVYEELKARNLINKKVIARAYRIPEAEIEKVVYFDPAYAVKITFRRKITSGSPGDTDVYGAQQHGPLLKLMFNL